MIELIGFWFGVSIHTVMFMFLPFLLFTLLVRAMVEQITDDESIALTVSDKLIEFNSWTHTYFGRITIPEGATIGIGILSLLWSCMMLIYCFHEHDGLVDGVSESAKFLAPAIGYVGLGVIIYTSIVYVGRRVWKGWMKVNELVNKVESK